MTRTFTFSNYDAPTNVVSFTYPYGLKEFPFDSLSIPKLEVSIEHNGTKMRFNDHEVVIQTAFDKSHTGFYDHDHRILYIPNWNLPDYLFAIVAIVPRLFPELRLYNPMAVFACLNGASAWYYPTLPWHPEISYTIEYTVADYE